MRIKIDNKIPYIDYFTRNLNNDIDFFDDQSFNIESVKDESIVIVRSTYNTHNLNVPSFVKLICSVSTGEDHIDKKQLEEKRIPYSFSTGANASAVAEYFFSCLAILLENKKYSFKDDKTLVIGNGNIGGKVYETLRAFNFNVDVFDPFRFSSIQDLNDLDAYKIITLHIPLTLDSEYPTKDLINENFLKKMRKNSILINTSRGGVISEKDFLNQNKVSVISDVFKNEPNINMNYHDENYIGTPHIAGHSQFARYQMTKMAFAKIYDFLGLNVPKFQPLETIPFKKFNLTKFKKDIDNYGFPVDLILDTYNPMLDKFDTQCFKEFRDNYNKRAGFAQRAICYSDQGNYDLLIQQLGFKIK